MPMLYIVLKEGREFAGCRCLCGDCVAVEKTQKHPQSLADAFLNYKELYLFQVDVVLEGIDIFFKGLATHVGDTADRTCLAPEESFFN